MLLSDKHMKDLSIQIYHSCIVVSDIIDNHIIIERYIGYTEAESVASFINKYRKGK